MNLFFTQNNKSRLLRHESYMESFFVLQDRDRDRKIESNRKTLTKAI